MKVQDRPSEDAKDVAMIQVISVCCSCSVPEKVLCSSFPSPVYHQVSDVSALPCSAIQLFTQGCSFKFF